MNPTIEQPQQLSSKEVEQSSFISGLERRVSHLIALRASWFVCLSLAFYLSLTFFSATHHKLWFDEINTALLARLPFSRLWEALRAGADTNPPLLYVPVRFFYWFTSNTELAVRLPSLLEFLLMMGCLYAVVRRYVSFTYALTVSFLPFLTTAALYVTEGRGYAAMLGFGSAALLCWRNASLDIRRRTSLALLAAVVAAAVSNHYSASLILLALFAGEGSRTFLRKRFDVPIWIAICIGGCPLLFYRPLMPAIHRYLSSYWAKPSIKEMVWSLVGWKWSAGLILIVLLILIIRDRLPVWMKSEGFREPRVPLYEHVAWLTVLCSPIYGYLQGKLTGGFTMRYAIVMAIPVALYTGILAYRAFRGTTLPALLILVLTLSMMAERLIVPNYRPLSFEQQADWIAKEADRAKGPIVIGDPVVFSPMYFYARGAMRARLQYVSNPKLSTKFLGSNSADLNMYNLREFSPMAVSDYGDFLSRTTHFFVADDENSWVVHQLHADHARIKQIACKNTWCFDEVWKSK